MAKNLTLAKLIPIGVSAMVGAGIYTVLGLGIVRSKSGIIISLLLGLLLTLLNGYSYIKLNETYIDNHGTVRYLREGFVNETFVRITSIVLILGYIFTTALYADGFSYVLVALLKKPQFTWIIGVILIVLSVMANNLNIDKLSSILSVISYSKIFILGAIGLVGLLSLGYREQYEETSGFKEIIISGVMLFIAYEGFEFISNVSEHILEPDVNIKWSYIISILVVGAIYFILAVSVIGNLSYAIVSKKKTVVLEVYAQNILGKWGYYIVMFSALLATSSAVLVTMLGTNKLIKKGVEEGDFPKFLEGKIFGSYRSLVLIGIIAILLFTFLDLRGIATYSSIIFIVIFLLVSIASYRLSETIGSNKFINLVTIICDVLVLIIYVLVVFNFI